ncbi:hypothetical protein ACFL27_16005 [candidate division CSSED10-310 bacterium]|uniref:PilZ domain-containing protein n=1 Tax=candidate division CSSED10-310 bacterium TaxID=2855610 RepID=A0ABV6YZR2_UNCC1
MKYGHLKGHVYCRYAKTPPIINSSLAYEYGIKTLMGIKLKHGFELEVGKNVKVRMILDNRTSRITCHATIDWVDKDEQTREYKIGLGSLSLSEDEFKVLLDNYTEESLEEMDFGDTVRLETAQTAPVTVGEGSRDIKRDKAITLPVTLIDQIDDQRGETSFSDFVVKILKDYLTAR